MIARRDSAAAIAVRIAQRLTDPARISELCQPIPPHSVLPGCAILAARLAIDRPEFGEVAIAHLRASAQTRPAWTGNLFQGTVATLAAALVVHSMLADHRLAELVDTGTRWLSQRAERMAGAVSVGGQHTPPRLLVQDYDAISGLAGLARVLLLARRSGIDAAEPGLTAALTALTHLLTIDQQEWSGWSLVQTDASSWIPSAPADSVLTGLAHGVAGPMATLAIAVLDVDYAEGREAIRSTSHWLLNRRDQETGTWPYAITGTQGVDQRSPRPLMSPPSRWCHGTVGIAQALHLAGKALADDAIVSTAVGLIGGLAATAPSSWAGNDTTLCCGYAGTLTIALVAARLTADARLDLLADNAARELIQRFDPESPLGFRLARQTTVVDAADMLYGAAGTALALYDYAVGGAPTWQALLLLR